MKVPEQNAQVVVYSSSTASRPWVMLWKSPHQMVYRAFESRCEAVEAARQVALGDPPFDCDMAAYPAKMPFTTTIPSVKAIEAWIDVADTLLEGALTARGAI